MLKICVICGKEFETSSSRRMMCYETHYHPCPMCGKPVITKDLQHKDSCCSKACSRLKAKQNFKLDMESNPDKWKSARNKAKTTNLTKYGSENVMGNDKIAERAKSHTKQAFDLHRSEIISKKAHTCMNKYGVTHPMKSTEVKSKLLATIRQKYHNPELKSTLQLPEIKQRIDDTNLNKYGTTIPMQTHDVWKKQSCKKSKYIASDGTKLDSQYEIDVYEFCLRNDLEVQTNIPLHYTYDEVDHVTYIDFKIDGQLFECKGEHMMEGYFDYRGVPMSAKLEVYRANHVVVITGQTVKYFFKGSNGLRYLNKCPSSLIGIDIELFRDPEFPYRSDRPKCFYDVKVDGQMSSHDAFFNEAIRWKMIKNRIQYTGGFIDSKQVLTALNVTRTCKQPSWFSQTLAERIISEYCSDDTIVDPFAGWGTRADAAKKLHKHYIGGDLNPELVSWHHHCGRSNIMLCNALDFTYNENCSVFICPPYSDPDSGRCFEDYNFEGFDESAKNLTQCQWLNIVMKNVPNATEYVMVCKIVDDGYEKYIIETKENKSHFGKNVEYILKVPNINMSNIKN